MQIEFEWNENKSTSNKKKHGISFEEAKTCFEDEYAKVFYDAEHSSLEDRSILIGLSMTLKTLVIVFTERLENNGNKIINRIISARKATQREIQYYWNDRKGVY